MNAIAIIPARYASTRLPGKPLLDQTGMPLIQHVVQAVSSATSVQKIVVATDDDRIAQAVKAFGGNCVMTRADHPSGTDRLAESAEKLALADDDIVVNVQGDEPEMPGACVDQLVDMLVKGHCPMATLATPLGYEEAADPNKVKVVLRSDGRALYFSRSRIPCDRDSDRQSSYLLHLGIYAYRVAFLKRYASLPPTAAEQSEKLEQLRALESGFDIAVGVTDYHGRGIDTPEDYEEFLARYGARG
ncbi:MAG: 3-deoxy-manno-octulosonate cytidylyltransferase [Phycisphaerales bacterium]|jgi:3-deoxy-manno-octulosonate cytidylyltransferase (CMP-KDO synthetase)|nr:3-deoxy-manno-octulosonate cytidylyltransferase [Phycisphaerales bacterium]